MYSNPPCNGAWVAMKVFTKEELFKGWLKELSRNAERIQSLKDQLMQGVKQVMEIDYGSQGPFIYNGLRGKIA